jgi:hypothetical protein
MGVSGRLYGITKCSLFGVLFIGFCLIGTSIFAYRLQDKDFLARFVNKPTELLPVLVLGLAIALLVGFSIRRYLADSDENIIELHGTRRSDRSVHHREGPHLMWSHVSIISLHGIDITGLDFTKEKTDKRTRRILRKNGAKA